MVIVRLPAFTLPAFKISKGWLLDVELLGVKLQIPPFDILFWPAIKFWDGFRIFDSDWITGAVMDPLDAAKDVLLEKIPGLVWGHLENVLEDMVDEYYEAHPEEKT